MTVRLIVTGIILSFVVLGCLPISDNPLPVEQDISADAQPLLGDWTVIEMLGMADIAQTAVSIDLESQSALRVDIEYPTSSESFSCFLHKIGDDLFISRDLESEFGQSYSIHKIKLTGQNSDQMEVYELDSDSLASAINSQELDGYLDEFEGKTMAHITDSSENLKTYVSSATDTVEATPVIVIQKL